jgi:hypothetical protein
MHGPTLHPASTAHTQLLSPFPLPPLPLPLRLSPLPLLLLPLLLPPVPPGCDSPGTCAYLLFEKLGRGPGAPAAAWPSTLRLLASAWEMPASRADVRDRRLRRPSSEARLGPDRVEMVCRRGAGRVWVCGVGVGWGVAGRGARR